MKAITTIVTPVDLEDHTEKLVEYAAYMADKLSASLILIHIVEPFRVIGNMEVGTTELEQYNTNLTLQAEEWLEKLVNSYSSCSGSKVIRGDIVDSIVDFAKEQEAGLIIIGTHGTKGIEKLLLGSVAERVVKNAHCPTLVMNPFKQ
ncbi:MAG: universal stress protein [Desulfopila sp.]|jgi:nucleotide-binding universal stress UspA family protein|nr:universal stress protein [Desulfopila sp.]